MNQEQQFKLQSFLDGELPDHEAREILAWTQRDREAAALLAELKHTRQALAKSEPHLSLPETREFFWSKIEREIQRQEPQTFPAQVSILAGLRRWLLPAVSVGALVLAGVIAHFNVPKNIPTVAVQTVADADAPSVETTLANADATTYRDASEGTTLVLFSYEADDNASQNKKPTAIN